MFTKLTEEKKMLLRKFVDFTCENCHKNENEVGVLNAHRIKRGAFGGTYSLNNIKMICKTCHKAFHYHEF